MIQLSGEKSLFVSADKGTVHAFFCSRIDYCNSLLIDLLKTWLSPLQVVR